MPELLPPLNLPAFIPQIMTQDTGRMIFDVFRKKYVALTPEEWVRQHFAHYLTEHLRYPKALLKVEGALVVNGQKKRADMVVYDKDAHPFLVVECKSPKVKLNESTFQQSAWYNYTLQAPYIAITNGLRHYCCRINHQTRQVEFQNGLPDYP
ncbi:MAG: type I restriction enzyme HsdR N-terminal domain-containing protein [Bacteroidota bacterium]